MTQQLNVGIIGCGAISSAYLKHAASFPVLRIAALADLDPAKARERHAEFNVGRVCTVDELLADPDIHVVLNLTIPRAHAQVQLQALQAGKHVYSEKPMGINLQEAQAVMAEANRRGLRVGVAPDTFLGAGHQTARKLLDDGAIGRPLAFTAFMMGRGVETWHPNPAFYYEPGGGPMFDMGPYYLTALLQLLGPINRLHATASILLPHRHVTAEKCPYKGTTLDVTTPDHIAGTIEFANGTVGTLTTSFAVRYSPHPRILIFGEDGTMEVPDPNGFDGHVRIRTTADQDWREVPHTHLEGYGRAVGLADLCTAVLRNRPHRASGDLACYVVQAMQAMLDTATTGHYHSMTELFTRPEPLPTGLAIGQLD